MTILDRGKMKWQSASFIPLAFEMKKKKREECQEGFQDPSGIIHHASFFYFTFYFI
jgi:hypothetical protein